MYDRAQSIKSHTEWPLNASERRNSSRINIKTWWGKKLPGCCDLVRLSACNFLRCLFCCTLKIWYLVLPCCSCCLSHMLSISFPSNCTMQVVVKAFWKQGNLTAEQEWSSVLLFLLSFIGVAISSHFVSRSLKTSNLPINLLLFVGIYWRNWLSMAT